MLRIRKDYEPGKTTYITLAARYGVGKQAIHKIITRVTWKHLMPPTDTPATACTCGHTRS